jgi:copper homeostasis protein
MNIEICVDSLEAALLAEKCGASRLELCSHLAAGGLTPSYGLLLQCKEKVKIPIHVMIRPRDGNFLYNDEDFLVMKSDVEMVRKMGFEGIVFGMLNGRGHPDTGRIREIVSAAGTMNLTFHRAFDQCSNPFQAVDDLVDCGIHTILTSGCKNTAVEGLDMIASLIRHATGKISIMPGSGINDANIQEIKNKTGASWFHLSAKKVSPDLSGKNIHSILRLPDEEMIRRIKLMEA